MSDRRPTNCRFRLKEEGKAYPRSSCQGCGNSIMTGLGKSCSYTQQEPPVAHTDLDAAVALALEGAAKQVAMSAPGEWFVRDVDRVHDAIRALIQPHQADALARVRQETWNAAIKAAVAAVPNGWTGKPYQSNIDYGPNTANYARTAISALARPVDGGAT